MIQIIGPIYWVILIIFISLVIYLIISLFNKKSKKSLYILIGLLFLFLIFVNLIFFYPYLSVKYYFPNSKVTNIELFRVESQEAYGIMPIKYYFIDNAIGLNGGVHDTGISKEFMIINGEKIPGFIEGIEKSQNEITSQSAFINYIFPMGFYSGINRIWIKGYIPKSSSIGEIRDILVKETNIPINCFKIRDDGKVWELSNFGQTNEECVLF
jgi:hypothetical protein